MYDHVCTTQIVTCSPDPVRLFTSHLELDTGHALEGTLPWSGVFLHFVIPAVLSVRPLLYR